MAVEDGVGEERARTHERRRDAVRRRGLDFGEGGDCRAVAGEDLPEQTDIVGSRGLVERNAHGPGVHLPQVDAAPLRFTMDRAGPAPARDGDRVEEGLRRHRVTQTPQPLGKRRREAMHALGDGLQPHRSVVDGVCRGHDRKQHLRRADVARRLLAPDVLLPRLQREPVSRFPLAVERHADQAARDHALVFIAGGEIGGVRAAEPERHAEALRRADRDVGAELARRR